MFVVNATLSDVKISQMMSMPDEITLKLKQKSFEMHLRAHSLASRVTNMVCCDDKLTAR